MSWPDLDSYAHSQLLWPDLEHGHVEEKEGSYVGFQHAEVHHVVEVAEVCLHAILEDLLNFLCHHPCETIDNIKHIAEISSLHSWASPERPLSLFLSENRQCYRDHWNLFTPLMGMSWTSHFAVSSRQSTMLDRWKVYIPFMGICWTSCFTVSIRQPTTLDMSL